MNKIILHEEISHCLDILRLTPHFLGDNIHESVSTDSEVLRMRRILLLQVHSSSIYLNLRKTIKLKDLSKKDR